jgi:hypothetical protein
MKPVLEDEQIIVDGQTDRQTDRQTDNISRSGNGQQNHVDSKL